MLQNHVNYWKCVVKVSDRNCKKWYLKFETGFSTFMVSQIQASIFDRPWCCFQARFFSDNIGDGRKSYYICFLYIYIYIIYVFYLGVQSVYEDIARDTNRGHTVRAVCESFNMAKDAGFKVVAHMMPDLPNMDWERDIEQFVVSMHM